MNNLEYLKENSGALAASAVYSGFWTLVLEGNMPTAYVLGMAVANFGITYNGYNSIKDLKKQRNDYRNRTFLRKKDLTDILKE